MSEQGSTDSSRRRGGGFPSLTLQDAVDAVVTAGLNGPEHTVDAFATYIGHATANSGAFRTKLASLRDWGLIARGDKDRVTLSGLAEELVLAHPDQYEAKELLLTAFESCRIFGMLYGDSAKNHPMEFSRLRTQVLMRYGVANNQAEKFVDSFVQSAVFAGLAHAEGTTVTLLPRHTAFAGPGDRANEVDADVTKELPSTLARAAAPLVADKTPVALRQQWPIAGGEIEFVIRTSEALPPSVYALVAEMAEVAEKMKVKLTGSVPDDSPELPPTNPDPENEG